MKTSVKLVGITGTNVYDLIMSNNKCAVRIVKYCFVHNFIAMSKFKTWSNIVR